MRSFLLFAAFLLVENSLSLFCPVGVFYSENEWKTATLVIKNIEDDHICTVSFDASNCELAITQSPKAGYTKTCEDDEANKFVNCQCGDKDEKCLLTNELRTNAVTSALLSDDCKATLSAIDFSDLPTYNDFVVKYQSIEKTYKNVNGEWRLIKANDATYGQMNGIKFGLKDHTVSLYGISEYDPSRMEDCVKDDDVIECVCLLHCYEYLSGWGKNANLTAEWDASLAELSTTMHSLTLVEDVEETTTDSEEPTTTSVDIPVEIPVEPSSAPAPSVIETTTSTTKDEVTSSFPENSRSNETKNSPATDVPPVEEDPHPAHVTEDAPRHLSLFILIISLVFMI